MVSLDQDPFDLNAIVRERLKHEGKEGDFDQLFEKVGLNLDHTADNLGRSIKKLEKLCGTAQLSPFLTRELGGRKVKAPVVTSWSTLPNGKEPKTRVEKRRAQANSGLAFRLNMQAHESFAAKGQVDLGKEDFRSDELQVRQVLRLDERIREDWKKLAQGKGTRFTICAPGGGGPLGHAGRALGGQPFEFSPLENRGTKSAPLVGFLGGDDRPDSKSRVSFEQDDMGQTGESFGKFSLDSAPSLRTRTDPSGTSEDYDPNLTSSTWPSQFSGPTNTAFPPVTRYRRTRPLFPKKR